MAQHNPKSRAYLIIVLVAIVACFMLAKLIMSGGDSDTHTAGDHETEHTAPAEDTAEKESTTTEEMPDRSAGGAAPMTDDVSPPDEMVDEPMLDEVPSPNEASGPAEAPAQNP